MLRIVLVVGDPFRILVVIRVRLHLEHVGLMIVAKCFPLLMRDFVRDDSGNTIRIVADVRNVQRNRTNLFLVSDRLRAIWIDD